MGDTKNGLRWCSYLKLKITQKIDLKLIYKLEI
jgi:hypothetical protein